jgi:hypothetical protein
MKPFVVIFRDDANKTVPPQVLHIVVEAPSRADAYMMAPMLSNVLHVDQTDNVVYAYSRCLSALDGEVVTARLRLNHLKAAVTQVENMLEVLEGS